MPEFVQLADKVPLPKVKLPCIGQLKYNGTRCIAIHKDGKTILKTRNQKEFTYPKLTNILDQYKCGNFVLDGELCFGDSKGHDHTKVSGIVNSSIHGNPIADSHKLNYNLFDILLGDQFEKQHCTVPYRERYRDLNSLFDNHGPFIQVTKTWEFESHKEIEDTFNDLLLQGYEGLILKYWQDIYVWKRSKNWIKMKAEEDADLICVDIKPGTNKYTGMIGALYCEGVVEGKQVKVKVGSGLDDNDRAQSETYFIGKTIEVNYNTVIQDKTTGEWSLFLPIFKSVRFDK